MPTSHWRQLNEIVDVIVTTNPHLLLDIGVGFGKYGVLAREYLELWDGRNKYNDWQRQIDGIEIFNSYKNPLYSYVYNTIYYGNAIDVLPNISIKYDLILAIDVLEHFNKNDGLKFIDLCLEHGHNVLISTPSHVSKQGTAFNNPHEEHKSSWTVDDFIYPNKFTIPNDRSLLCYLGKDASKIHSNS